MPIKKRVSTAIAATGQPVKVIKKRASKAIVDAEKVVVEATLPIPDPVVATVKPVKAVRKRASKVIADVPSPEPILTIEQPVEVVTQPVEAVTQPVETVVPVTPPLPTEENPLKPYQILNIFKQRWPKAFDALNVKPFAIGVHKQIHSAMPELSVIQLKKAMSVWCCGSHYLRVCTEGATRYGLDGLPNGTVNAEHAEKSKQLLQTKYPGLYASITKKDAPPKPLKSSTHNQPKPKQDVFVVTVKSVKVTVPLKVSELPVLPEPKPNQKQDPLTLQFQCGDVTLTCTLNPKSYRKAMKDAHPDSMAVVQGKLGNGGQIVEAGLTVTPPKATAPDKSVD